MNFDTADKVQEHKFNGVLQNILVVKGTERVFIPMNPKNSDYQEYLKWVNEGNTPEPDDGHSPLPADE